MIIKDKGANKIMITEFKKSSLLLIFLGALNDIYANPPIYAKANSIIKKSLIPKIAPFSKPPVVRVNGPKTKKISPEWCINILPRKLSVPATVEVIIPNLLYDLPNK